MKQFLAVYTGNSAATAEWMKMDAKTQAERTEKGMKAWQEWGQKYASAIVFNGGPLGKTKKISRSGISDITNAMAAFVVVQAESHAAAAEMFVNHPHFSIFPGDGVEIMETLPIPSR